MWLMGAKSKNKTSNTYTKGLSQTQELPPFPYYDKIGTAEGFESKRYRLKGETFETIGRGHYLDNESEYTAQCKKLGIKDKENLTDPESWLLCKDDVDIRRREMQNKYPSTDQRILDEIMDTRYQFSPDGFEKYFGDALRKGDISTLQSTLIRLGKAARSRKEGGNYTRWVGVANQLEGVKARMSAEAEALKKRESAGADVNLDALAEVSTEIKAGGK